jgi:hypothetical protein
LFIVYVGDASIRLARQREKSYWPLGVDVFLGVLEILGAFYRIFIPNGGDWLVLMCAFTLWVPASQLAFWVKEKNEVDKNVFIKEIFFKMVIYFRT